MATVTVIQKDITTLKGDVSNIKGDISNVKGDVSTAKNDIKNAKSDISNVKTSIEKINGDIKNLQGKTEVNGDWSAHKTMKERPQPGALATGHKVKSQLSFPGGEDYEVSLELILNVDQVQKARLSVRNKDGQTVYFDFNDRGEIILPPSKNISDKYFTIANDGTAKQNGRFNFWGNGSDRESVLEFGAGGYVFYAELTAGGSKNLTVNGVCRAHSFEQTSDRDLKDNIRIIDNATDRIRKMNGYTYTLKSNGMPYAGIIAQEAMIAIPEVIGGTVIHEDGQSASEEGERFLTVDYSGVVGLLVQVCRESDERISKLENDISELKDIVSKLINKGETLN